MNENRWEVPAQEFFISFEVNESHSKMTQEENWFNYFKASSIHDLFLEVTSETHTEIPS